MKIVSHPTILANDNIDTDRIIPARFLTTTNRKGLGHHLFDDWPEGAAALGDASILVTGHNFGCGSSREHAVWALIDRGFMAVISTGFADIFHANSLRNGLAPIIIEPEDHARLTAEIQAEPERPIIIDFAVEILTCGAMNATFKAAAPSVQDTPGGTELDHLLFKLPEIKVWEAGRRPRVNTMGGS